MKLTDRSIFRWPLGLGAMTLFCVALAMPARAQQNQPNQPPAQPPANPAPNPAPNQPPQVGAIPVPQPSGTEDAKARRKEKEKPAPGNPPQVSPPQPAPAHPGVGTSGGPHKPEKTPPPQSLPTNAPVESVVAPVPNEVTEKAGNVSAPEPVADELPEGSEEGTRITILKKGRPIEEVFDEINKKTGVVVRAMEAAKGIKVDLRAKEKTVKEVLDELIMGKDLTWIRRADGSFEVWDKPSFIDKELRKRVIRRIFPLRYVSVTDVQSAVEGVKSDVGAVAANPRTNELIVTDLPDKVALIESILKEIDVQLYTRTFKIKHAKFDDVQSRLPDLKSPAGMIQVDAANRLVIVTDTFEKIKQMEQLIEMLDIDQPIRIYNLNSIGLEAADAKDLVEDVIKPLATEDALIQFNETQSTLLVKDVAEVHDRILEVLKAMDKTPKQVWIEGEILQVSRDYKFEFGTEWTYSPNLPRAIKDKLVSPLPHVSTGSNSTSTSGTQTTSTRPDDSIFPIVSSGAGGLKVMNLTGNLKMTLDALMSDDKTQILLQPRALVRNREEVAIDLTQENPQGTTFQNTGGYYPQNGTSGGYGGGIYGSSIVNVVTGLTLSLTPSISNRGLIEMDVDFENSTPVPQTIKVAGQENNAVGRNSQHIQTILIIPSGETRVLGGLISRSSGNSHAGIPYLSKVPWIGWLFGKKTENNSERNLLFFLTPTIVEEKPQIDLVDAPVNAAARAISDQPATEEELEPAKINPIPPDLIPFIQSEHPELNLEKDNDTLILPKPADAKTSGAQTSSFGPAPSADQLRLEAINTLLHDNPSPLHSSADSSSLPITGPGATMLTAGKGATGPSGLIGSGGGGKAGVPTAKRGGKGAAVPGAPAGGSGMPGPARGLAKNPPVPPQLQGPQPQQPQPGSPQQPVQPAAPQPNPIPPAQQVPPPAQPPSPANP